MTNDVEHPGNILHVTCRSSMMTWFRAFSYFQKVVSFIISKFLAFFKRVKTLIFLWSREKKGTCRLTLSHFLPKPGKRGFEINKSFCFRDRTRFWPTPHLCKVQPSYRQVPNPSLSLDTWSRLQIPTQCPSVFWPILSCWRKPQRPRNEGGPWFFTHKWANAKCCTKLLCRCAWNQRILNTHSLKDSGLLSGILPRC